MVSLKNPMITMVIKMIFKGKFGITYDDTVMEVPIKIKGEEYVLGVNPRSLVVEYIPAEVQEELDFTWNHMWAQLNRTHGYEEDPREYNKPCDIMTLKNILFHLSWNNWNDRIEFRFDAFDDEIMNLANVKWQEIKEMTKEIENSGYFGEYPSVVLNEKETSSEYSHDVAKLEVDGFHTYHTHGGYGAGCFPVNEEYLGFFVGEISGEEINKVSKWVSQIHSDMKEWVTENKKLGIDTSLIENVRSMIAYEIEILEDSFHPIFLNKMNVKRIYIGGHHDPSSYGSHESRYLEIDYVDIYGEQSYNQHLITSICHGGNGQGCFDVWDYRYGAWYDSEYLGVTYNTLKKWKNMEREYFSSIKTLKADYYDPQEDEVVILRNGVVKSSTKDGGEFEYITIFVEFDRFSRSGNPVYKRTGDALISAVWLRWEEEVETSSKRFLHLYSNSWFGNETEEKSRLMKFPGWSSALEDYVYDIRIGDVISVEDIIVEEIFNEGMFIPGDREEEIMCLFTDKAIVEEKVLQLKIKRNLQNLEGLFLHWLMEDDEEEIIMEMVEEEICGEY